MKKSPFRSKPGIHYFSILFLIILSGPVSAQLISWSASGLSNGGPSPWTATSSHASLTAGGLTKGSGIGSATGANAWGGSNWTGTSNQDATFTVTSNPGCSVSYTVLDLSYRRSNTGPNAGTLEYTFGASSTAYTVITSLTFTSTVTSGVPIPPVNLSSIANLQNVPPGTVVKFRILPTGGTSAGTWYVNSSNALSIGGIINPLYGATIAETSLILCNGQSAGALTASVTGSTPPYTYSWSPAGGTSSVATSLAAGIYSCLVTSSTSETTLATYTLTEPAILSSGISLQDVTCNGGSNGAATVTASGGTPAYSYTWLPTGGNASSATNLPAGIYTVNISDSHSCTVSQTVSITQPGTLTVITPSASSSAICDGSTVTLTGSGANTYTWTGGITDGIAFSPSITTTYSVTGADTNGCQGNASISVTVNPLPTITINSGAICPGNVFTLTPGGASTYTFSNGSATVMPITTSSYSVTGTSAEGCESPVPAVAIVTVAGSLTVTITGPSSICYGETASLTAGGANSYTWSTGDLTYTASPSPTVNTTYTVTGSSGSCSNTAMATVSVNPLPTVSITGSSVICSGETVTLTANGSSTYSWSTGSTSNLITPTPSINATYTVKATDSNGCSDIAVHILTVNPIPVISLPNGTICTGESFTFNPSGASTYTFSGGPVVSPTISSTYSVSGTNSLGCVSPVPVTASITVNSLPIISVNSGSVCAGKTFTMIPGGALTYTFSNGSSTVSPTSNSSYSVSGTNSAGCVSQNPAISNVTVHALPVVTVNSSTLCAGKTFTMLPGGALTYTYSNGSSTVIPTANSSYSVTGTSSLGCISSSPAIANVTVSPLPVISVNSGSICSGTSFTLIPGGASTYTFSGGAAIVSPTLTTSYFVSGTSSVGCVSSVSATSNVTVISLPVISINSGSICSGNSFTLLPAGASTYTFLNGSASVSPTITTSYSVTGSNSLGCAAQNPAVSTVTVHALPTLSVTSSASVCNGDNLSLTVSGANTYTWSTNSNSSTIVITPSASAIHSVTGTNSNGCQSSASHSVTVYPTPTIIIANGAICPGGFFTLTPSGATTYTFSNGTSTISPVVSPSLTTSYSVTGTSSMGCISSSPTIAVVTVTNSVLVSISGTTLVCSGQPASLTASGAGTYTWDTGAINQTIAPTPSVSTNYSVTGSSGTCSNTAVITVSVLPTPVISIVSSNSAICSGENATLTASGSNTLTWTGGISNGISFSPSVTATYTVYGTGSNNCVGSNTVTVLVHPNPTVIPTSNRTLMCTGETATLSVGGALSYSWNTNATTSLTIISPSTSTSYTVTGTDINGCKSTAVVLQNVAPCTGISFTHSLDTASPIIFPNPSNGDFIIKGENLLRISIVNELGQTIQFIDQNIITGNQAEIKGMSPGIYFITITSDNSSAKQKVIVTR